MIDTTILFVPWQKSLGSADSSMSKFAFNLGMDDEGRVRLKNPQMARSPEGMEYEHKNNAWIKSGRSRGKTIYEVWYSGSMSVMLLGLTGSSQIYVRGHCLVGSPTVFSKSTGNPHGHLKFNEVADRLIDTGLRVDFSGKIKCYNCHSAEGIVPFAQLFADYLYDKGYKQCTYYGYEGALESLPDTDGHKYSTAGGRASKYRTQIIPKGLKKS